MFQENPELSVQGIQGQYIFFKDCNYTRCPRAPWT